MLKNSLYKLELINTKYCPIIISILLLINDVLSYFDINFVLLNYLAGVSLLTLYNFIISSLTYRFCIYHQMFHVFIAINSIITIYDTYLGIPLNDMHLLMLYLIIALLFLFLIIYLRIKYGDRKND